LLLREVPAAGVAAASGGNHGAAVAYAAMRLGHKARIFVPEISSPAKIARIRGYGADLAVGGKVYAEALAACEAYIAETSALSVHAFDQVETMLGAGSVGLEFEQQVPDLDTLLVAVGGGGLIGGVVAWYEGRIKVIGVEPRLAPTLAAWRWRPAKIPIKCAGWKATACCKTFAWHPGASASWCFPDHAQRYVAAAVLVEDEAIASAQRAL
jgi:threonine dehydratase